MVLNAIKQDKNNKKVLKGELVIIEDTKDDCVFGRINFTIDATPRPDVQSFQLKRAYHFGNISEVKIWGDLRDHLSITCDGIYPDDNKQTTK